MWYTKASTNLQIANSRIQKGKVNILSRQDKAIIGDFALHITEFQQMMNRLYLERDLQRGVKGTFEWLKEEIVELGEALDETDKEATAKEFADVIAWLSSLANVMEIDLEKAALTKYANKCPKCYQAPCECKF